MGSEPVPCPTGCKQKTPRGTSENAFSVVMGNAQNSAPSKTYILNRRWFFVLVTFIADIPSGLSLGGRAVEICGQLRFYVWGGSH